jgi:hypothetical protein
MSNFKLVFTNKSEDEFINSAIYYETQQKGLGYKFSESINAILALARVPRVSLQCGLRPL